jgi:hypothetical protein
MDFLKKSTLRNTCRANLLHELPIETKGNGNAQARRSGKEGNGWVYAKGELKPKHGATSKNTWVFDGEKLKLKSSIQARGLC